METKEKILDKNSPNAGKGVYDFSGEKSDIYAAMDIWGKQEAIAFSQWIDEECWLFVEGKYWHNPLKIEYENQTTEQLYDLFIIEQSKK